jgi:hypothetical protein
MQIWAIATTKMITIPSLEMPVSCVCAKALLVIKSTKLKNNMAFFIFHSLNDARYKTKLHKNNVNNFCITEFP